MNFRIVGKYCSYLILAESVFLLPALLVSRFYQEYDSSLCFLITILVGLAAGLALYFPCRRAQGTVYPRESFVVAGGGWVLLSLLGALPFWLSGQFGTYIDAVFETVSGFTTTGASILRNVEAVGRSLLFWRSFTHWLGGIGILVFILAIVSAQANSGGAGLQLLRAESTGPQVGKLLPKTRESVKYLYLIYVGLSVINLALLLVGGMPLFDALCVMFGTAGTGGFGIKNDSMASYSPYLQNVTTLFMALFGVNFSLYYFILRRQWKVTLKDEELRVYAGIMLGSVFLVSLNVYFSHTFSSFRESLHHGAFTVSSIMTTTGFATTDFDLWPEFSRALLLVLMFAGSMAGSTGGGFKSIRILILFKSMQSGLHRLLHPRSVKAVRINGKPLEDQVMMGTLLYGTAYSAIAIVSYLLLSLNSTMTLETNLSAMLSCLNNIGPGLGLVGPVSNYADYSLAAKALLTVLMLLGRLEIFPILILLTPSTWRRKR